MLDEIVRHQIWLQQYGNGLTKEVTKDLEALRDRINARILNAPPYELERLSIILKEINLLISQGMAKVQPSLWNELAEYENEFALKTLDDSTPASITIGTGLNTAALTAITAESIVTLQGEEPMTIREMIKKLSSRYAKDIESEIRLGIADGSTNAQIVKRLTDLANTRTKNQIESVVLTVTNHVGNTVRDQVFGKYDKLFKGKRYLTVLDNRVSDICMSRSGRLYPLDTNVTLPAHYRCRSTWRFELKDEYSLGDEGDTQSSVTYDKDGNEIGGKQVPINMTYSDWLKRQPEAVINEVLGKERSRLFRDGKLELSQFVNNRGRTLTLEELKKRDLIK